MTSPQMALRACASPIERLRAIPRDWCADNPVWTQFAHRVFIVVAELERLNNRVCRQALASGRVDDAALETRVRALLELEEAHGYYHDEVYEQLRLRGYEVDSLIHRVREETRAFEAKQGLPGLLAVVAGLEHIAASVGTWFLRSGRCISLPQEVRTVLGWRAVVGLRHHGTAFALYEEVCGGGYLHRARGLAAGAWFLNHLQHVVMAHLSAQELRPTPSCRRRQERRRFVVEHTTMVRTLALSTLGYLRPGFMPQTEDSVRLAEAVYAKHGCGQRH